MVLGDPPGGHHHGPLLATLLAALDAAPGGQLTFRDFMALVLYEPEHGYYSRGESPLGFRGDFVTAPHLGPDFGELLAVQVAEIWHHLGCPAPFDLVELGPGRGLLADQLLQGIQAEEPDLLAVLRYTLIETAPALALAQRQHLQPWLDRGISLIWQDWATIPAQAWCGCVVSNEWVDALPVHRVQLTAAGLQEVYVTRNGNPGQGTHSYPVFNGDAAHPLTVTLGPPSRPELLSHWQNIGVTLTAPPYPVGYTTEVNLAALDYWGAIARALRRGYLLTIDYGYEAPRYYAPRRTGGTLQCYYRQRHHDDPLWAIGHQDITAHVDFTALQRQGQRLGFQTHGLVPQALFLMALGLGDRLAALSHPAVSLALGDLLQRRECLHQLIDPLGLGNFQVLIQSYGLSPLEQSQPLRGLTIPR